MKTSGTNRKLRVLLTAIKSKTLIPRPEFQRRLVWANKHKQEFLRTVLMEYPFPEIYIAAGDVDPNTGEGNEMLVDGQQRMTTLYQYFTGSQDLRLGDLRPYSQLSDTEKLSFLEYEVVVRDLGKKTIEEIKEVFTRINSTRYSLNAMEIHNARYDGALKQFCEHLVEASFFEENRIFTNQDVKRMGDLLFCLTVVVTIMSSYFNRDEEIEDYLEKYNDEFLDAVEMQSRLDRTFSFIRDCNIPATSRAWKKADLFNLVVEIDRCLAKDKLDLRPETVGPRLQSFYIQVDKAASGEILDEDIQQYYKATIQATNDRSSRVTRGKALAKAIRQANMRLPL